MAAILHRVYVSAVPNMAVRWRQPVYVWSLWAGTDICILDQMVWISHKTHFEGILPKGPYLPCVSMAGRALLAGYPRFIWRRISIYFSVQELLCWGFNYMDVILKACDNSPSCNSHWCYVYIDRGQFDWLCIFLSLFKTFERWAGSRLTTRARSRDIFWKTLLPPWNTNPESKCVCINHWNESLKPRYNNTTTLHMVLKQNSSICLYQLRNQMCKCEYWPRS